MVRRGCSRHFSQASSRQVRGRWPRRQSIHLGFAVRNRHLSAIRVVGGLDLSETSDNDRLEAIFREHYEAVLAYARRRAPEPVADDVAAETFAIAWRKAEQIPPEPLPWLLGVARRVLSTQRRSTRRRSRLRDRLSQTAEPVAPIDVPDVRLGAALSQLSERDQEALLLVAWEGLAPRDAAAVLGLTQTGFSVRLHRARRRLQAALEPDETPKSAAGPNRSPVTKGEAR